MLRKKTKVGFMLAALLLLFISVRPAVAQDDYGGDVDYQEFYDELDPYGQWVSDPDYGYVWIPDAGDDFRPYYSNGYWAYTDYGNTWVSNYSWGWAPFHYGRWTYHNYYGWMWVPGNVWGPAWVSWRSGGGAYGWAPLGPGISINVAIGGYSCPDYWWNFAPQQHIFDRRWNRYSYGPRYNNTYIRQTTIINNTYIVNRNTYLGGPRRDDLRRAIGREPRALAVNNLRGPQRAQVRGDRLNVYRPAVSSARPSGTMRPREFRAVERPIRGNTPASAAGFGSRQDTRALPANGGSGTGPRINRPNTGSIRVGATGVGTPERQTIQQPDRRRFDRDRDRSAERVPVQNTPDRPDWNARPQPQANPRRFENTRPQQQVAEPQPRSMEPVRQPRTFERPAPQAMPQRIEQQRTYDRPQPQQQRRFEQPRPAMQPPPQPQRNFGQPRPQMQQRTFEQHQVQPQRIEAPRQQPAPGSFGGQREGGNRFGR